MYLYLFCYFVICVCLSLLSYLGACIMVMHRTLAQPARGGHERERGHPRERGFSLSSYSNSVVRFEFDKFRVDTHLCKLRDAPAARF